MKLWVQCPVCKINKWEYFFKKNLSRINKCTKCGCMAINPQPSNEKLKRIYSKDYFIADTDLRNKEGVTKLKQATAKDYLYAISKFSGKTDFKNRTLLEIGCGNGEFLKQASLMGYQVFGIDTGEAFISKLEKNPLLKNRVKNIAIEKMPIKLFDIVVFNDVIEHTRDPDKFLNEVYRRCKIGGTVFCATPSLDSLSSRFQGSNWVEFKEEHLFYFNNKSLKRIFYNNGFSSIVLKEIPKTLNLNYIVKHFERFNTKDIFNSIFTLLRYLPEKIKNTQFTVVASGVCLLAKKQKSKKSILSIIIPVFNEVRTFSELIKKVLCKQLAGFEIEIIVVESNSTDGTKELVKSIEHSRVKKIFQNKPEGKGFAVRAGLKAATGDIILIQDADLEYDIDDYDTLIQHIIDCDSCFVLGTRHSGRRWKIRSFSGQPVWAFIANCVHWALTGLINMLYGVRLTDPFTMYKVFRASIIHDIEFETKRFDFDYELLLKLIRRGYKPIEVPINYSARSFSEGKKVSIRNDPVSWMIAIFKYRFSSIS
jgi:2-polyprenyl-3-methyl-5-hydroxy-6-metoxy-1,4-benzoquinol methylase